MDITSSSSDSYQFGWTDLTGPSTFSVTPPRQASPSEEDVILASSRPKKRSGRTKFKETRHPVYRGVRKRNTDRWVCELREPTKQARIWLGTYPTAEMAARAHDVAALALRGQSACLNFADSVWRLPVPASIDAKAIRKTAMEAAEAFRPRNSVSGEVRRDNVEAFDRASSSEEGIMGLMNTPPETVYHNSEEGMMGMFNTPPEPAYYTNQEAMEGMFNTTPETAYYNNQEVMEGMFNTTPETVHYNDQEAMFDMPWLMQDMAEGMMLSPPCCSNADFSWHNEETADTELPLWSYSF